MKKILITGGVRTGKTVATATDISTYEDNGVKVAVQDSKGSVLYSEKSRLENSVYLNANEKDLSEDDLYKLRSAEVLVIETEKHLSFLDVKQIESICETYINLDIVYVVAIVRDLADFNDTKVDLSEFDEVRIFQAPKYVK